MADSSALRKTSKRKRPHPKTPSQKPKTKKRDKNREEQIMNLEDPSQKDQVLQQVQPGLFFSKPKFGIFLVGHYSDDFKKELKKDSQRAKNEILNAARDIVNFSLALNSRKSEEPRSRTIIAFDPDQWSCWFENDPKLTKVELRPEGYLAPNSQKFLETGGDVFFLIKSDVQDDVQEIYEYVKESVGNFFGKIDETISSPPSKRIIHSCFQDGIVNPSDTETLKTYVVTDDDSSSGYPGSTYLMTQKFEFNWTVIGNMQKDQKEDMIGRKTISDAFIPFTDERTHIARAHVVQESPPIDAFERHQALFRVSMPYGTRPNEPGREEGLMYMSISNTTKQFVTILENIAGDQKHSAHGEVTVDMLISSVKPLQGTFWYVPSAQELGLNSSSQERRFELQKYWDIRSPANQYIFYNQREYLYRMTTGGYSPEDTPSRRVLRLLSFSFLNWNDQWFKRLEIPNLPNLLDPGVLPRGIRKKVQGESVMVRKGWAIKMSLTNVFTTDDMSELEGEPESFFKREYDTFSIHPDELIVGQMPVTFSLGLGKVVMPYLQEDEKMPAFIKGLSESSGMGHVIPDYETLLKKGLDKMIQEIAETQASSEEESCFLTACTLALEGVQTYMRNFSLLAGHLAQKDDTSYTDAQRENLEKIEARMKKLSTDPPEMFLEAVQLLYSYHCCLHLIGEPTSIGRLDQLLEPFLRGNPPEEAQEIIDCLWIKLGSQVHLNRGLLVDQQEWGMTAVPYSSTGMFPHGDTINQWVQQITVGGCKANEKETPEDACNDITLMCLKASRRLPLNAPCLSLRMHKGIPDEVLHEAAKTVLSGGAHPIFPHDDRIVNGLQQIGTSDLPVSLKTARNYSCDGCYEPIFPGETQFSLAYVTLLQVLEMAINHGATYLLAGPAYLEGTPQSLPTTRADDIKTFEEVKELFATHLKVQTERQLFNTIVNYGNIAKVCPSPLLSAVVRGCLETKRDIYDAGAKFTIVGVQFISFSNTVDSLYAIKKLCFDHDSAVTSLAELVCCLKCDWGFSMKEPFHEPLVGHTRGERLSDAFKGIRESTLALPKFGTSAGAENDDIQGIASWLAERITTIVKEVSRDSLDSQPLKGLIQSLKKKNSIPGHKWDILLPPGSGTFEGYVGSGLSCAASADGRRAGSPIASDMSAAPTPLDLPAVPRRCDIYKALKSWDNTFIKSGLANGAEVDLKIEEDFKEEDLVTFLKRYAEGKEIGGNILTITCANPDTLANALKSPEKYDLIRVRTGGWSEFYIAFFTAHQKHQERRVYYQVTKP